MKVKPGLKTCGSRWQCKCFAPECIICGKSKANAPQMSTLFTCLVVGSFAPLTILMVRWHGCLYSVSRHIAGQRCDFHMRGRQHIFFLQVCDFIHHQMSQPLSRLDHSDAKHLWRPRDILIFRECFDGEAIVFYRQSPHNDFQKLQGCVFCVKIGRQYWNWHVNSHKINIVKTDRLLYETPLGRMCIQALHASHIIWLRSHH